MWGAGLTHHQVFFEPWQVKVKFLALFDKSVIQQSANYLGSRLRRRYSNADRLLERLAAYRIAYF